MKVAMSFPAKVWLKPEVNTHLARIEDVMSQVRLTSQCPHRFLYLKFWNTEGERNPFISIVYKKRKDRHKTRVWVYHNLVLGSNGRTYDNGEYTFHWEPRSGVWFVCSFKYAYQISVDGEEK